MPELEPEREPEPKLFESRSRGGNKKFRLHNSVSYFGTFFIALATSWRHQVLLYAHSKYPGNCSMRIQNMAGAALFDHIGAQSNINSFMM